VHEAETGVVCMSWARGVARRDYDVVTLCCVDLAIWEWAGGIYALEWRGVTNGRGER